MGRKSKLRAWLDDLDALKEKRQIVRFVRKRNKRLEKIQGFVGGTSDKFVLVHILDWNTANIDGYCVIPIRDIKYFQIVDEYKCFAQRALALRGYAPEFRTDIDLTSFQSVLTSANKAFPLIVIHIERLDPDIIFIGPIEKLKRKKLILRKVDAEAKWASARSLSFKDITRVEFGKAYEGALWVVRSHEDEKNDCSLQNSVLKFEEPFEPANPNE
jgi:hypothetical protein